MFPAKVLALLLLANPLMAQPVEGQDQGPIAQLEKASLLYAEGLGAGDAGKVITAFEWVQAVSLRKSESWEMKTQAAEVPALEENARGALLKTASPYDLLTEGGGAAAWLMAEGDDDLIEKVEAIASRAGRNPLGEANAVEARLEPKTAQIWNLPFAGMEATEIGIFGDQSAAYAWKVTDHEGKAICAGQTQGAPLYCSFTPEVSAWFHVEITALGTEASRYLLITN